MRLLLGTTNQAKIADYKKYLVHSNLELLTLKDLGFYDEPLEIGQSFEENAVQKARFYAEKTELPALSEDGGLEVETLDGQPGVNSSRWVGPFGTDEDRINKILDLMRGVTDEKRGAKLGFVSVIYFPAERECVKAEGHIDGKISKQPSGKRVKGFPYRAVFYVPKFDKLLVDLTEEELDEINHRKMACKELLLKLEPWLNN